MSFLYWIYEDTYCFSLPHKHGYVGVSEDPNGRWRSVRFGKNKPKAELLILYEGAREECLRKERKLRPNLHIGWNVARGGTAVEPRTYGRRPIGLGFNFIKRQWDKPLKNAWRGKR